MHLIVLILLGIFAGCTGDPMPDCGDKCSEKSSDPEMRAVGYWENWKNVKWWDNKAPGNCQSGCIDDTLESFIEPYTQVNYSFVTLIQQTAPAQVACPICPIWDGNLYINTKPIKFNDSTNGPMYALENFVTRVQAEGKKAFISVGGWSDWARIDNDTNAETLATALEQLLKETNADGIDFDFEHLSTYLSKNGKATDFDLFAEMINALSKNLKAANVAAKISYTTRFNAFGPKEKDPAPYASNLPKTKPCTVATDGTNRSLCYFASDNEGAYLWPKIKNSVDYVNIMAYDATTGQADGSIAIKFDAAKVAQTFVAGGVPASKIIYGFEPVQQAAGGQDAGLTANKKSTDALRAERAGGILLWAINQTGQKNESCLLASYASKIPSKCQTPSAVAEEELETPYHPVGWLE